MRRLRRWSVRPVPLHEPDACFTQDHRAVPTRSIDGPQLPKRILLEGFQSLFGVAGFYYLSRFIESPQLSGELPHGSTYFAFALVGFAFFDYLASRSMFSIKASKTRAKTARWSICW